MFIVSAIIDGKNVEQKIDSYMYHPDFDGAEPYEQEPYHYWHAAEGFLQKNPGVGVGCIYAIHKTVYAKDDEGYDDTQKPIGRDTVWDKRGIDVYINAYEVTQDYGGPQEGGWWYDCWSPFEEECIKFSIQCLPTMDVKERFAGFAEAVLENIESDFGNHRSRTSAAGGFDVRVSVEFKKAEAGSNYSPWC